MLGTRTKMRHECSAFFPGGVGGGGGIWRLGLSGFQSRWLSQARSAAADNERAPSRPSSNTTVISSLSLSLSRPRTIPENERTAPLLSHDHPLDSTSDVNRWAPVDATLNQPTQPGTSWDVDRPPPPPPPHHHHQTLSLRVLLLT